MGVNLITCTAVHFIGLGFVCWFVCFFLLGKGAGHAELEVEAVKMIGSSSQIRGLQIASFLGSAAALFLVHPVCKIRKKHPVKMGIQFGV